MHVVKDLLCNLRYRVRCGSGRYRQGRCYCVQCMPRWNVVCRQRRDVRTVRSRPGEWRGEPVIVR